MRKKKKRIPIAVLVASLTLVVGSITGFAAFQYLSPAQVAERIHDSKLMDAFSGKDAVLVNETQEFENCRVTFLGTVAGKNISEYLSTDNQGKVEADKIYMAVALENSDGTPMPDTSSDEYGQQAFFISPFIGGLNPNFYNAMSMGGGYTEFVEDGILYRLVETDNIEMFADREIYLGVNEGTFYDADAYLYEEATGKLSLNPSYQGINALFTVPLDPAKADPEAAEAYLKELEASWEPSNNTEEPLEKEPYQLEVDEWMDKLLQNPELLKDPSFVMAIESTRQTCTPDKDGMISAPWNLGQDGASGTGIIWIKEQFPDNKPGTMAVGGYCYSNEGLADLLIEGYELNADGTVTFAIYKPVLN